ncbi:MAG: nitronate monooxygenase [Eubacteriales bacterium]|nr:nitronate monooxygenase [Eubacteriales bacterium]MDD3349344.1 nitronate monooxygenase [Eubacteriales bacterium]
MSAVLETMPELIIGDLRAKTPIIQGGMGVGVSLSSLASAVANEGGIGVMAVAALGFDRPEYKTNPVETGKAALREEIQKAKKLTKGILGVNIMVALSSFSEMVKTAVAEEIDVIFAGAGLPLDLPQYLSKGAKTKLVPIISSARAAEIIIKKWVAKYDYVPDAFVVEGPLAGGHLGFRKEEIDDPEYSLDKIIPQVIAKVREYEEKYNKMIPVIAAGGIYTGSDILHYLRLGAAGVQMGTRFVATHECDASAAFKQTYIDCKEEDIMIIHSPVGLPGRAIKNEFLEQSEAGKKHPFHCPFQCIKTCEYEKSPYCIALALMNAQKGILKNGFAFAGQNAYRIKEIVSVHELIESLKGEYRDAVLSGI